MPTQCWVCWGDAVFEVGGAVDLSGDQDGAVEEQGRLAALDHVEALAGQRMLAECRPVVAPPPGKARRRRVHTSGWTTIGKDGVPRRPASPARPPPLYLLRERIRAQLSCADVVR